MRGFISQIFSFLSSGNYPVLNYYICDNCFFTSQTKTIYGKKEVLKYLRSTISDKQINHFNILNSLKEDKNTLLITYNSLRTNNTKPLYGSAIIKMKENKIYYVKNYIVNDEQIKKIN